MKIRLHSILRAALFTASILFSVAFAVDDPKPAAPVNKQPAGALKWRVQKLFQDNNEGCAIADFNHDGHLDISAGEFWYPGPDFKEQKPLRKLDAFGKDYLTTCGEHAYDVNGDGLKDIVVFGKSGTYVLWNLGK